MPIRVAIYTRVSTRDQTCGQQLHELREYAGARQWVVQGEYVDNGVSGKKESRPSLNRLMEAARRRTIDAVICTKLDRWGRSLPHIVDTVQELRKLGVRFIAVSQGIDTDESNPTSRLMLALLGAFSEFERELIVERTLSGLAKARREGRIGGRPKLVIDRYRVREKRASGSSISALAREYGVSRPSIARIVGAGSQSAAS